jgi:hypothetical protein
LAVSINRRSRAQSELPEPQADEIYDLPPDQSPDAVSLLKIKDNQCRWPLTDAGPGFLFCGSRLFDGPYCCRHYKLAHRG